MVLKNEGIINAVEGTGSLYCLYFVSESCT